MKKAFVSNSSIIILVLLFLINIPCLAQKNRIIKRNSKLKTIERSCDSSDLYVFIMDASKDSTSICNGPNGKCVIKVFQQTETDVHFVVITKAINGWFKIDGPIYGGEGGDIQIPGGEGWVFGSDIGAETKLNLNESLHLYKKPNTLSRSVYTFKKDPVIVRLKDICGKWVKVKYKGKCGWIESKWLCGYFYTLCS